MGYRKVQREAISQTAPNVHRSIVAVETHRSGTLYQWDTSSRDEKYQKKGSGTLRHGIVEKCYPILTIFFFDFDSLRRLPLRLKLLSKNILSRLSESVKYKVYKANSIKLGTQEMKNRQESFLSLLHIVIFMGELYCERPVIIYALHCGDGIGPSQDCDVVVRTGLSCFLDNI